jgi:hypothetical protein
MPKQVALLLKDTSTGAFAGAGAVIRVICATAGAHPINGVATDTASALGSVPSVHGAAAAADRRARPRVRGVIRPTGPRRAGAAAGPRG